MRTGRAVCSYGEALLCHNDRDKRMKTLNKPFEFQMFPQPDDETCGPTCLHSVYLYYGKKISLETVISEVPSLDEGGTLAVLLGCHALKNGFQATVYTYNLLVFDPTWFEAGDPGRLIEKLASRLKNRSERKLRWAIQAYINFLELGGRLQFEDLTRSLIRRYLTQSRPILTGLSATYLYRSAREIESRYDDVNGDPVGHFVVLCGYDPETRRVRVADPLLPNPYSETHHYEIEIDRVICSILLGILTYDANLLIIERRTD